AQRRALEVITSDRAARAFALHKEPAATRARYGPHPFAQRCLLARRLVEAGVRTVTVEYLNDANTIDEWDDHCFFGNIFERLKKRLAIFDRCLSALLEDLQIRGLLDNVLV